MSSAYLPLSGITKEHFLIFQNVARRPPQRIIVVRNTNTASTLWIGIGYPPKPKSLEALHTDDVTGKVTAKDAAEVTLARSKGFYVIDHDGVARRNAGEALDKKFPFNTPDKNVPGQVIDPHSKLAFVGDYDLMGVIDPTATGRVIALATSNGLPVCNRSNPNVNRVINDLNALMGENRVLHGPQDLYAGFRGGCTAFLPDGTVRSLPNEHAVRDFYQSIGRQTITGSYRPGA